MKKYFFSILFCLIHFNVFPQAEFEKWEGKKISYVLNENSTSSELNFDAENIPELFLKSLTNLYWFFISDVDGDNCPFSPTCSAFLIESIEETNVIKGALMFADRFTRDINFFDKAMNYPFLKRGKLFDPPQNYTLNPESIKVFESGKFLFLE